MSGGYFNYDQFRIAEIASDVEELISEAEQSHEYREETIAEFRKGLLYLNMAYIYAKRIDWLVSDDDGEDSFHKRLKEELGKL